MSEYNGEIVMGETVGDNEVMYKGNGEAERSFKVIKENIGNIFVILVVVMNPSHYGKNVW